MEKDVNALSIIADHQKAGDLVFVSPEDIRTQKMFIPEVTVLKATPADFHNISGKMMPKSYYTDRIGNAAGVDFVAAECSTRKEGEFTWVGRAQGKKRLPDGTMKHSQAHEYEFDVEVRSEEDFAKDAKKPANDQKYIAEVNRKAHINEMKKFARARAGTGARLKVIRELAGIPTSFDRNQISRALVVARIAINSDAMFENPEMRQATISHVFGAGGVAEEVMGPRDVTEEPHAIEDSREATAAWDAAGEEKTVEEVVDITDAKEVPATPVQEAIVKLEEWLATDLLQESKEASKEINELIDKEGVSLEELQGMIDKCVTYQKNVDAAMQHKVQDNRPEGEAE